MLKSIYIVTYLTIASIVSIATVSALFSGEFVTANVGVLLASGPIVLMIGRIMLLEDRARTGNRLWFILVSGLIGLAVVASQFVVGQAMIEQVAAAALMVLLYLGYDYWYSRLDRSQSRIEVGATLPEFTLYNVEGGEVPSGSLKGQPAIFMFYRGNWCPLCIAQIKEVAARYNELKEKGVRVFMVSPQPESHTRKLAKKFDAAMDFLRDEGGAAAKALGIDNRFGTPFGMQALGYESDTVLPTVIITDGDGVVQWVDETDNYRVRPEPDTFFEILSQKGLIAG